MPVPLQYRHVVPSAVLLMLCGLAVQVGTVSASPAVVALPAAVATMTHRAAAADTGVTTMDGVYTSAQATAGSDVFAAYCRSCHTPTVHSGPPFRSKWFGRPLAVLYGYIKREMPKSEPGSMSDEDYAAALAYLLKVNGMPAGDSALPADSAALHRIRLDSVRIAPVLRSVPK